MLISGINSLKEILPSKRYKSISNFKSSHNKKSAYFKRDNLEGSFNEHKKDQTILSITALLKDKCLYILIFRFHNLG